MAIKGQPIRWIRAGARAFATRLARRLLAHPREHRLGYRLLAAIVLASTCIALVATGLQLVVDYQREDWPQLQLAYAITSHRAQGSEWDNVVVVVSQSHYMMLQRNLLYTGVTRGKRLVVATCNCCSEPPDWQTRKSCGDPRYPIGGYGLPIVGALADRFRHAWAPRDGGCVRAQAEFFLPEPGPPSGDDRGRRLEGQCPDLGIGQDRA